MTPRPNSFQRPNPDAAGYSRHQRGKCLDQKHLDDRNGFVQTAFGSGGSCSRHVMPVWSSRRRRVAWCVTGDVVPFGRTFQFVREAPKNRSDRHGIQAAEDRHLDHEAFQTIDSDGGRLSLLQGTANPANRGETGADESGTDEQARDNWRQNERDHHADRTSGTTQTGSGSGSDVAKSCELVGVDFVQRYGDGRTDCRQRPADQMKIFRQRPNRFFTPLHARTSKHKYIHGLRLYA